MLNVACPAHLDRFSEADHLIVRQAMALLPRRQLEAVTLRFWEGLSETEISLAMNTDWRTVERLLGGALARLKDLCISQPEFSRRENRQTKDSEKPGPVLVKNSSNKGKANGIAITA